MQYLITTAVCLLAGLGAGLGTGFAGMSAAAVITPMLVTFLGIEPYTAVGIALASDVLASAVSAYTYGKNKNLDIKNGLVMMITVLIFTVVGSFVFGISLPDMVGILCGATTNTPALGAAQQTLKQMGMDASSPALGCAVTYPLGVVGVILAILFMRKALARKEDLQPAEKEDDNKTYIGAFQVHNPAIFNKSVKEIAALSHSKFVISRLWRNGNVSIPTSDKIVKEGDRLLVVTSEGCEVCDWVRGEEVLRRLPVTACFVEREQSPANLLVAQALATRSFPTSYLFDGEEKLLGYFKGVADFGEQLEGLMEGTWAVAEDTLAMFDNAFRALRASSEYDAEGLLNHAWASVGECPYFFNHYLLYDYYRQVQVLDSAEYYKQRALDCLHGADAFVFEDLIREMDPGHSLLEWVDQGFQVDSTLNE